MIFYGWILLKWSIILWRNGELHQAIGILSEYLKLLQKARAITKWTDEELQGIYEFEQPVNLNT